MGEFADRVILVTGASGGLGGAVVRAFLDAGATVAGVARVAANKPTAAPRFFAVVADVATPDGAQAVVQQVVTSKGKVDALVHLVGGFSGGKPVWETDDKTWDGMMRQNLDTAFYMTRAVLPHMLAAGRGRILAVGSRTGVEPVATLSAYGASKAALIALVRTVAAEVRDSPVTANVVLPSVIDTPANRVSNPDTDYSRWVKPESIAALLLWLASDAAASVNGAAIPIYGRS